MPDLDASTNTPEPNVDTAPADEPDTGDDDGADQLGDAGKKALDRMKAERNAERQARREAERLLAEARAAAAAHDKTPDEQVLESVRRDAEAAALARANERILRAEVRAAAAGKLADPADALRFLDLSGIEVDEDGTVDPTEIADLIDTLIKNKPYLAAQGGRKFQGSADTAPRNAGLPQITSRDELARLSPEERLKAHADGRLDVLLGKS